MNYTTKITQMTVNQEDDPLYGEFVTNIVAEDEAAGVFLKVIQPSSNEMGTIRIDPDEWPVLRAAIDKMMKIHGGNQ